MIITIDGPAGTGKTTVARTVAEKLGFAYFDTGAMYRSFAWLVLQKGVDLDDVAGIAALLKDFNFSIVEEGKEKRYFVNGEDVTQIIRSRPVTAHASTVSALKTVRDALLFQQHAFAKNRNAVFEGRDLGTVIFPHAEVKIFLTADPTVRAERRLNELAAKNPDRTLNREELLAEMARRDEKDSTREVAPLRCAADAHQIDTTHLSIDQVVDAIVQYTKTRTPKPL